MAYCSCLGDDGQGAMRVLVAAAATAATATATSGGIPPLLSLKSMRDCLHLLRGIVPEVRREE